MSEDLARRDLFDQVAYIEFDFDPPRAPSIYNVVAGTAPSVRRIDLPVSLFYPPDGKTWRVLDQRGVVHVFPAPGVHGCVVRYEKVPGAEDPAEL